MIEITNQINFIESQLKLNEAYNKVNKANKKALFCDVAIITIVGLSILSIITLF